MIIEKNQRNRKKHIIGKNLKLKADSLKRLIKLKNSPGLIKKKRENTN